MEELERRLRQRGTDSEEAIQKRLERAAEAGNVTNISEGIANWSVADLFFGLYPGSIGETSTFVILIGAAILLITGIASWKVMLSVFAGGLGMGLLFNAVAPETNIYMQMPAYYHLLIGGFAFGAVFMATDPVSAARTSTGKYIYGFLIGVIAVLIRVVNPAYPEGMMLAILFMNTFAPLIDYYVIQNNINKRLKRIKTA
jgi:Na+-transporting NADH:ubiquinone oxidoreductase subunit B